VRCEGCLGLNRRRAREIRPLSSRQSLGEWLCRVI
jgi:hypothetical protein